MARKVVIRTLDGRVLNVVEIDPAATWVPPVGATIMASALGNVGDTWDGTKFVTPTPVGPDPQFVADLQLLKDFQLNVAPTGVQTAAAVKAQTRILRRVVSELT